MSKKQRDMMLRRWQDPIGREKMMEQFSKIRERENKKPKWTIEIAIASAQRMNQKAIEAAKKHHIAASGAKEYL